MQIGRNFSYHDDDSREQRSEESDESSDDIDQRMVEKSLKHLQGKSSSKEAHTFINESICNLKLKIIDQDTVFCNDTLPCICSSNVSYDLFK